MEVTVLVIIYRGRKHITLHEDEARASQALLDFVDKHWIEGSKYASISPPLTADERIKLFFSDESDLYMYGIADLSELGAHVESIVSD